MAKSFTVLREKMTPEQHKRSDPRLEELRGEVRLQELRIAALRPRRPSRISCEFRSRPYLQSSSAPRMSAPFVAILRRSELDCRLSRSSQTASRLKSLNFTTSANQRRKSLRRRSQ